MLFPLFKKRASPKKSVKRRRMQDVILTKDRQDIHLRQKRLRIELILSASDIKKLFSRYKIVLPLISIILIALGGLLGYLLLTRAQIVHFYPSSCLGGWENPQNAQGKPDLGEEALMEEFNETNSAVLKDKISEIYCGDFQGEVPPDAESKKVVIKFSWAIKDKNKEFADESGEATTTSDLIQIIKIENGSTTIINSTSTEEVIENKKIETNSTTPQSSSPFWREFGRRLINLVLAEESESTSTASTSESATTAELESASDVITATTTNETITAPMPAPLEILEPPVITTSTEPSDSSPPLQFEASSTIAENPSNEITSAVSSTDAQTTSGSASTTETTEDSLKNQYTFLEILYTLDGLNWQSLRKVGSSNLKNLELELPNFNWNDISKLQVKVMSLSPVDYLPAVYLDGLWLEIEYGGMSERAAVLPPASPNPILQNEFSQSYRLMSFASVSSSSELGEIKEPVFDSMDTEVYAGDCFPTSYAAQSTSTNIYVYVEGNTEAAYGDFSGDFNFTKLESRPVTLGVNLDNYYNCDITLLSPGVFHFLEIKNDPERMICADNVPYENCRAIAERESVIEVKEAAP